MSVFVLYMSSFGVILFMSQISNLTLEQFAAFVLLFAGMAVACHVLASCASVIERLDHSLAPLQAMLIACNDKLYRRTLKMFKAHWPMLMAMGILRRLGVFGSEGNYTTLDELIWVIYAIYYETD